MSRHSEDKTPNQRQSSSKISSQPGTPSLFQIRPEQTQVKQLLSVLVSSVNRKSQKDQDIYPERYKVPQSNQCFSDAVVKLGGQTKRKELRISETANTSQRTPDRRDKTDEQTSRVFGSISKMRPTIESPISNHNQNKQLPSSGKNYFLRPAEFCQGKRTLALNELSRSIQNSSNSHRTLSSFQTKRSEEELQQRKSTRESVMIKNKYNKLLSHSILFQPKALAHLKLPETSRNMFEMNIIQEIDNKNINSENNFESQSQSVIKDRIQSPKQLASGDQQSPKKTLSHTASQQRLQSQLIEMSKGVFQNKNKIESSLKERENNKTVQSASFLRPLVNNNDGILPRSNSAVKGLDNRLDTENVVLSQEEQQSPSRQRIATSSQNLDKSCSNLLNLKPQKFDEDIQYFEEQCYYSNQLQDFKEESNYNSVDLNGKEKTNSIDYCLFEIMEQLETQVVGQLQAQGQKFSQDCFLAVQKILTEHIPSVLLRLRQSDTTSSQDTNLHSFVSYSANFLSWFLSAADSQFTKCVDEKVKIEEDKLQQQIASLQSEILEKQQIIEAQIKEINAIQLEMVEIKQNFQEEKSKLNFEINSLEEKIEEMANADSMQDTSHKLSLKIIDLQTLMNNLQRESQSSGKHLEDHLCSLGFSVLTKTKQDLAYFEEVKKDFTMAKISDDLLLQILNDHPFFTAFTYNKIINHKNNLEEEQIELGEEETESLLKEYFKSLKEDEIDDAPCAESFMEFILSKHFTQSQSFREIEQILRIIMKDCSNPLNLFFQRLFGIGGFVIPSQEAVKDIIVLSRELNKLQSRQIEEQVNFPDEVDKLVSRIVSNQNAVIDFRNKFINPNKLPSKTSPYIILGHLLSSISSQEELEKVEDICNSMAVSQNDSLDCFEQKLSYKKVKQIAQQLRVRPFTFFNYLLLTYEKYSRNRKKPVSNSSKAISFDSRPIPKVLQDCYVNFSRYQQMQYAEGTQNITNRARASSNKQYNQNLSQESDDYIVQARQSPATSFSRSNNIGKRKPNNPKLFQTNVQKLSNSLKLINFKAQATKKDKSDPQNSILDFSGSSKQSKNS